jgi:hypothetical protein
LRRVKTIKNEGNSIIVETEDAKITDVIENLLFVNLNDINNLKK